MPTQHDPEAVEIKYLYDMTRFSGAQVLEIGSGDGRLTWHYAASAGPVIGLDPDAKRLAAAQNACPPNLRVKVRFVQSVAEYLPFRRETFDLALLAWSL